MDRLLRESGATMNSIKKNQLKSHATKKLKLALVACAGILLAASGARAEEGDKTISKIDSKTAISLGTATPGGGFPLYGNAFAEIMNAADPTLSIEPRNTKGSNENIPLLEEGKWPADLVDPGVDDQVRERHRGFQR